MIIQLDAVRRRRRPRAIDLLRRHLTRRLRWPRRRAQSVYGLGDHLRRDIGLDR